MKLSAVARGVQAERPVSFKYHGTEITTLLRPLSALEETDVAAAAIKYAKAKGGDPTPGNSIYEAAYMANVLALACVDPDSSPAARTATFDGGADQVLKELDTDTMAQLHEQQQLWQEECAPSRRTKTVTELLDYARTLGGEDAESPFVMDGYLRLSPLTRWRLARTMASLLAASHVLKPSASSP